MTPKRYRDAVSLFGSDDYLLSATANDLRHLSWKEELITSFLSWRDNLDPGTMEDTLRMAGITPIGLHDKQYPSRLKQIYDPPLTLFVRGTIPQQTMLAVVGTRVPTPYGETVTEMMVRSLAEQHICIVSGLARGIDGIAHATALAAHGSTIAVLGGGCDNATIYPPEHRDLAERIIEGGGAVLSEYPPRTAPTTYSFPKRNRIIAGLSQGTLVTEAGQTSGALVTAQCALDMNRDVFAIPHPITSTLGEGTNTLLKQGAIPVTTVHDIIPLLV